MYCSKCNNLPGIKISNSFCPKTVTNDAWTQISVPESFSIPDCNPDVCNITNVTVNPQIISSKIVVTPTSNGIKNREDCLLTGFKLLVYGVLKQKILYSSNKYTSELHSLSYNMPFSTFIMLSSDATPNDKYCVKVCIEDVYVKAISSRDIFKNVTIFLNAIKTA